MRRYLPSTIYRYLDLPSTHKIQTHNTHKHNTTHSPKPWPKPPTHSPHTPSTPPQPKHRHISHFSPVPLGLVKTNPIISPIHLQHLPPRPEPNIHMSHTPPTPPITLISSTSPALDKQPEPRVHPIYALTATTPPPATHQHCRHPGTLTFSQHTHMQPK